MELGCWVFIIVFVPMVDLSEGLCFTTSSRSTRAEAPALNATELCRKYAPANFSRYYYPYRTQSSFLCVTNCTLNVPGSIDCNSGFCRVTLEGPRCL
ncbi:hypothetical protein AV530_008861 [Patagioenas fasciata monilis]|uniref:Uncharacterized protein n=1 Tax=Patagioenas fasciata monilis TaxID=372326 RepID=A0A1V4KZD0_PATFA|nr:hypothetical protein AV530_008861 [Patagioenas fasciata monilis]